MQEFLIFSYLNKNNALCFDIMSIENGKRVWYIVSELKERQVQTNENLTVAFLKKMNKTTKRPGQTKKWESLYINKNRRKGKKKLFDKIDHLHQKVKEARLLQGSTAQASGVLA